MPGAEPAVPDSPPAPVSAAQASVEGATHPEASAGAAVAEELPIIPLKDAVVFPATSIPLLLSHPPSVALLESHGGVSFRALVVAVRPGVKAWPRPEDLEEIGTVALIHRTTPIDASSPGYSAIAEGLCRARRVVTEVRDSQLLARVAPVSEAEPSGPEAPQLILSTRGTLLALARRSGLPGEVLSLCAAAPTVAALTDMVAGTLPSLTVEERQALLGLFDPVERARRLFDHLARKIEQDRLAARVEGEVQEHLGQARRQGLVREQIRALEHQLEGGDRIAQLRAALGNAQLPAAVAPQVERELARLERLPEEGAEHGVQRAYLEWVAALPWSLSTAKEVDLLRARTVLDEDHFGLEDLKQRLLEHLAVLRLNPASRGTILCLVGPPGVGKTSIGRSIARALDRRFVRVALGGLHEEAEIRGHRRTYVSALPGQILQGLRRAGSNDPVFMLDELDKLGRDSQQGDPSAALMEVLDPEQNGAFRDNYLDLPFDLSRVLFIATANTVDAIPAALRDRLELLELPGYSEEEKLEIAERHLVQRQLQSAGLAEVGLADGGLRFERAGLQALIARYTHEAGVRGLERCLAAICRKQAARVVAGEAPLASVGAGDLEALLGPPVHLALRDEGTLRPLGVAAALAWTPGGGELLLVEAVRLSGGSGALQLTGQLGPSMQESAKAAFSWVRANARALGIAAERFAGCDVHVHVPAGAVPKDGPSAGLALVTALVSAFSDRPARGALAMTGEVTLSGRVLPIGGVRSKVLAARRAGARELILPRQNEADVAFEVPEDARREVAFHYVDTVAEAVEIALASPDALVRVGKRGQATFSIDP